MLSISSRRSATSPEWDSAWAESTESTFSMSRTWCELWCRESGGYLAPDPLHLTFSDGCTAVLPLATYRQFKGLTRGYVMPAGGGYGGPISAARLEAGHYAATAALLQDFGDIEWTTSPFTNCWPSIANATQETTHALALDRTMSELMQKWGRGHRSAFNKAMRHGVSVNAATTLDEWRAYFGIYQDSLRRWGDRVTSRYEWAVFEDLWRQSSHGVRMWLARFEGIPVAGAICLEATSHVTYWHGAALEEHFDVRPANAVMHRAIEDAQATGRRWFDFGFSGGHDGVATFKRGFGAEQMPCQRICRASRLTGALSGLARWKDRVSP